MQPSLQNQQQQNTYEKNNRIVSPVCQQFVAKPATTTEYNVITKEQTLENKTLTTMPNFIMIRHTQKNSLNTNNIKGKVSFFIFLNYSNMQ